MNAGNVRSSIRFIATCIVVLAVASVSAPGFAVEGDERPRVLAPPAMLGAGTTNPQPASCTAPGEACDDANPCTTGDSCDADLLCVGTRLPDGTECDDGNACTVSSECRRGMCQGAAYAVSVSAAEEHTCALREDGHLDCWGYDGSGQVSGPNVATESYDAISAGRRHTCALRETGRLSCWGYDEGQAVSGPNASTEGYVAVSSGASYTCALRGDARLACWGYDDFGQVSGPNAAAGTYIAVSAGVNHTCAVRDDGRLDCWGYDGDGQVSGPSGSTERYASLSAGAGHTCAVRDNGRLDCWGYDGWGAVSGPNASVEPYAAVSVGLMHTCALRWNGHISCWGSDQSQDVSGPNESTETYSALSAGYYHTCALRQDGHVTCWGGDRSGSVAGPNGSDESYGRGLCDDGDVCTTGRCDAQLGCNWSATDCADTNSCSLDSCEPETGCVHVPDPNQDADGDGVCDDTDNCRSVPNPDQANADGDAHGDACDACPFDPMDDADLDGRCADQDNCPGVANPDQIDADRDGIGDACDPCPIDPANDQDSDGLCANVDNCPGDSNPDQADEDADGWGDACDGCPGIPGADGSDGDYDGVTNCTDNCREASNPDQADADGDGVGDRCDNCPGIANAGQEDQDPGIYGNSDGRGDVCDNCPTKWNPDQMDQDGDGIGDLCDAPRNVELLGRWPALPRGPSWAVAQSGNLVFTGSGPHLVVLEDVDPDVPEVLATLDLGETIEGLAASGAYVLAACGGSGVRIVDVTDPAAPSLTATLDTPGHATALAVAGDLVYVADGAEGGLRIIEFTDPRSPREIGFFDTPGSAVGVHVGGNRAYVADERAGLRVLDVSNPAMPSEVGSLQWPQDRCHIHRVTSVDVVDGLAIVANAAARMRKNEDGECRVVEWDGNVTTADVSDSAHPVVVGTLDTPGTSEGVSLDGSMAYVADGGGGGVRLIDVSDPAAPTETGWVSVPGEVGEVVVDGARLRIASGSAGLWTADITNPGQPTLREMYLGGGSVRQVVNSGDRLIVADGTGGLRVIDVSNPATPVLQGTLSASDSAERVVVSGNLAYVVDGSRMRIVDVSDPTHPTELGVFPFDAVLDDVAVSGNLVALSGRGPVEPDGANHNIVRLVDVSDPAHPQERGVFGGLWCDGGTRVEIDGDRAYVGEHCFGSSGSHFSQVWALDIAVPESPLPVAINQGPGRVDYIVLGEMLSDLSRVGSTVYCAYGDWGLRILDFANLANPSVLAEHNTPGETLDTASTGRVTFVADGRGGLRVMSVVDPANVVELGSWVTETSAYAVAADGAHAYVGEDGQVLVFRFLDDEDADAVPASADNCPLVANPEQTDGDGDGIGDACDACPSDVVGDVDRDGVCSDEDNCPELANADQADLDRDAIGDACDPAVLLDEVGRWPHYPRGRTMGLAVHAGRAYVVLQRDTGQGEVAVFSLDDPQAPELAGLAGVPLAGWDNSAFGIAVEATTAFVAGGYAGLQVVDVSDPSSPRVIGQYRFPGWFAEDIAVVNGLAYVAARGGGLWIFDVSTPVTPTPVGQVGAVGSANNVAVSGSRAFLGGYGELTIVDVTDPRTAGVIGRYDTTGQVSFVSVAGNLAYVLVSVSGYPSYKVVQIVDVSNPSEPALLSETYLSGWGGGLDVVGTRLYVVGGWEGGLHILDVSNPASPIALGELAISGYTHRVEVEGGLAYLANTERGLLVADVTDPTAPGLIDDGENMTGTASGVTVADDNVVLSDGQAGVHIFAGADIGAPSWLGTFDTSGEALQTDVADDRVYVADRESSGGDGALRILDASDPTAIIEIGSVAMGPRDVDVAGTLAYVAAGYAGLRIVDLTDAQAPTEVGSYDTPGYAMNVAVDGTRVYVADHWGSGLRILDVSDPTAPVELGSFSTNATDVEVVGDLAYVTCEGEGLRILDVSDPAAPAEIASIGTSGDAVGLALSGHVAYVAATTGGLRAINVSDPAHPFEEGHILLSGDARDVAIHGGFAYVAAGADGLITVALPADTDGDGVLDALDNCPDVPNPDQADTDGDGIGDACALVAVCNDVTVPADGTCVAAVDPAQIGAGSHDPAGGTLTYSLNPPGPYGLGETTVALTVMNGQGASSTCQAVVTVVDATPPEIAVALTPAILWPPDHRMVEVEAAVSASDNCGSVETVLASVTSSEPDDGEGDGNTVDDIQQAEAGTPDLRFLLRAERAGAGPGRTYTAVYTVTDGAGKTASASGTAFVPHDQGGRVPPDVRSQRAGKKAAERRGPE